MLSALMASKDVFRAMRDRMLLAGASREEVVRVIRERGCCYSEVLSCHLNIRKEFEIDFHPFLLTTKLHVYDILKTVDYGNN